MNWPMRRSSCDDCRLGEPFGVASGNRFGITGRRTMWWQYFLRRVHDRALGGEQVQIGRHSRESGNPFCSLFKE
jgi:hypothetical protein